MRQELDQRRGGVELEVVDRHGVRWSKGKATVARRDGEGRGDRARGSGASPGGSRCGCGVVGKKKVRVREERCHGREKLKERRKKKKEGA